VSAPRRRVDVPRLLAYRVLREVTGDGAYANLALSRALGAAGLDRRDAAFVTELVAGTCRRLGTYDRVIAAAAGRDGFDDDLRDILRLAAHQLLGMRVPPHAAIATSVDLAAVEIGERVAGLVNAVGRKIAARDLDACLALLTRGLDAREALALRTHHPRWIVDALADVLPETELEPALAADNVAPVVNLAVRPGLASVPELVSDGAVPDEYSPYGATYAGAPGDLAAVREGRAGVQDEGSQLMALALAAVPVESGADSPGLSQPTSIASVDVPADWWLDMCAGPGGKAALLAGLAGRDGARLVAAEVKYHRADLVRQALRVYEGPASIVADGTRAPFRPGTFAKVLVDAPCSGLGALRRRPESRWTKDPADVDALVQLQAALLTSAIELAAPGGVIAYVTCSPHAAETEGVIAAVDPTGVEVLRAADLLPGVPQATRGERFVQLWPHRHGTDAMFLALLRRSGV